MPADNLMSAQQQPAAMLKAINDTVNCESDTIKSVRKLVQEQYHALIADALTELKPIAASGDLSSMSAALQKFSSYPGEIEILCKQMAAEITR